MLRGVDNSIITHFHDATPTKMVGMQLADGKKKLIHDIIKCCIEEFIRLDGRIL